MSFPAVVCLDIPTIFNLFLACPQAIHKVRQSLATAEITSPRFQGNSHIIDLFIPPMGYLVNKLMARTARISKLCFVDEAEAAAIRMKNKVEFFEYCSGRLAHRIILRYSESLKTSISDAIQLGFDPSPEQLHTISNLHNAAISDVWRRMVWQIKPLQEIFELAEMSPADFGNATYQLRFYLGMLC